MAVTTLSTTGLNKFFLEYIKPGLEVMWYNNTTIYDRFKTDTDTCLGKYGVQKVVYGQPKSARPSSSTTFPTADSSSYSEFTFYMKRGMYASLQFDNLAIACSKGSGAVKELVKSETENLMAYIPNKLNKQFWGDGSGRLGIVKTAVSASTTCYVDGDTTNWGLFGIDSNYYTDPGKYLFEGMSVDIYTSAGVKEVEDVKISTMSDDAAGTNTLTMAEAITCGANSLIFDHDTYATTEAAGTGVPMGLQGIISATNPYIGITASSAFQGVDRTAYTWACGQVFNMGAAITTPAVVTEIKLLECIQKMEKWGTISVILTNDVIWRVLFEILKADKTMPNDPGLWGGLTGIKFFAGKTKSIPIIYDEDCPDGRIYFFDDGSIKVSAPDRNGLDWLPGTDGNILSRVQGKDEYVANLRWYYNMTCSRPKANGYLRYVKHSAT